jgi:hypothetical protein
MEGKLAVKGNLGKLSRLIGPIARVASILARTTVSNHSQSTVSGRQVAKSFGGDLTINQT